MQWTYACLQAYVWECIYFRAMGDFFYVTFYFQKGALWKLKKKKKGITDLFSAHLI